MEGPPGDRGVNYRTLQQLFNTVEARRDQTSFTISVSLLEVLHPGCACKAGSEHCPVACLFTHGNLSGQQACPCCLWHDCCRATLAREVHISLDSSIVQQQEMAVCKRAHAL